MNEARHRTATGITPAAIAICLGIITLGAAGKAVAFEVEPKAKLHMDYGTQDADVTPMDSGWIVRRAEIGLEGKFNDNWSFEVEYDLSDGRDLRPRDGDWEDVSLTYEGWRVGDVSLGQSKIPFGLAEMTGSNDLTFIERALPVDALAPSRRIGVAFSRTPDNYTLSAMVFGSSIGNDDRGYGAAARLTLVPVHTADTVVHLGVAAVIEEPRSKVDFDAAPESRVPDVDFVNTGRIDDVDRVDRFGLEAAWRKGPLSLQAEWMQANVRRGAGLPDATFDGWYAQGSWVLTGESRPYKNGRFKGIEPTSRAGAWEVTARYSRIDLDDSDIFGGIERNVTVGLNYYLNDHLRIMFNYIQVQSERRGQTDNPDILLLRAQFVL